MRKLLLPAAAALVCLSCAPPPFNLGLSLSARTARALTVEGTVGPVEKLWGYSPGVEAVFLPEKGTASGIDLQNGFVLYTPPGAERQLGFVSWDSAKKMYMGINFQQSLGISPVDPYPDLVLMTLKGAAHFIGGFSFSTTNPAQNAFVAAHADPATGQFPSGASTALVLASLAMSVSGTTGNVIGASQYPERDPAFDSTYWLFKAAGTDQFLEMQSLADSSGVRPPALLSDRPGPAYTLGAGMPAGLTRVLYYYDPDPTRAPERSFMSWYDQANARWRCWAWWGVSPAWQGQELPDVSHRIDALLTTGELLSTEGDVGRLYSRDGVLRATFSLTGLKLAGEYYVSGAARVLFSQALFYDKSSWFNVYSIPSADLATLAQ